MGTASPPLTAYLQLLTNKKQNILILGAGNAYEAEWLWKNGFQNVYVVEVAREPLEALRQRIPSFPSEQLILQDFFNHNAEYDLIIEQTFFCALPPQWRTKYVAKMKQLLKPGGRLTGVLFDFPLTEQGPPYGGSYKEYLQYFSPHFKVHKLERCYNSIKPRTDREFFIHMLKE